MCEVTQQVSLSFGIKARIARGLAPSVLYLALPFLGPGPVLDMRTQQQTTSTKISAFVCILGGTVNAQTSDASRGPVKWGEGLCGKRKWATRPAEVVLNGGLRGYWNRGPKMGGGGSCQALEVMPPPSRGRKGHGGLPWRWPGMSGGSPEGRVSDEVRRPRRPVEPWASDVFLTCPQGHSASFPINFQ